MSAASIALVRPQAQLALTHCAVYDLRELTVEQTASGLVISGSVSSYYHKQLAQEVVRRVVARMPSDVEIVNHVSVRPAPPR